MARPLGFDPDQARAALMDVFWTRGFEATSMQDIEAATGLAKQSLYRQFGDKRAMYHAALKAYGAVEIASGAHLVAETPGGARAKLQALFDSAVEDAEARRGCFLCNASAEVQAEDDETRALVRRVSDQLGAVFLLALGADAALAGDPAARAAWGLRLHAGYVGLRVLLKAGLTRAEAAVLVEGLLEGL
jgi:TetR/AcrR family transcriptional regulator, transcriptional repressor for nem operon